MSDLAHALRHAIRDALLAAGHDDLAELAEEAADEIGNPVPCPRLGSGRLIFDPTPGSRIDDAATFMAAVASRTGHRVTMKFNGIETTCDPGEFGEWITRRHWIQAGHLQPEPRDASPHLRLPRPL